MAGGDSTHSGPWEYDPSLAGNVIFIAIFAILTAAHVWLRLKHKQNYLIPLIVGGILEIIGYVARTVARNSLSSVPLFALQSIFILLSPILFAATCYMTLVRVMHATHAAQLSPVPPQRLTKLFVTSDVVCFWVQAAGGGLQASSNSASSSLPEIGKWVVIVGLVLQLVIFGLYFVVSLLVHLRLVASKGRDAYSSSSSSSAWRTVMYLIYASCALISLRNLVRIVEYAQGFRGWIASHEPMLFVFDGMLMAAFMLLWTVLYPPRLLEGGSEARLLGRRHEDGNALKSMDSQGPDDRADIAYTA